jgi:hypothetical protein
LGLQQFEASIAWGTAIIGFIFLFFCFCSTP